MQRLLARTIGGDTRKRVASLPLILRASLSAATLMTNSKKCGCDFKQDGCTKLWIKRHHGSEDEMKRAVERAETEAIPGEIARVAVVPLVVAWGCGLSLLKESASNGGPLWFICGFIVIGGVIKAGLSGDENLTRACALREKRHLAQMLSFKSRVGDGTRIKIVCEQELVEQEQRAQAEDTQKTLF